MIAEWDYRLALWRERRLIRREGGTDYIRGIARGLEIAESLIRVNRAKERKSRTHKGGDHGRSLFGDAGQHQ